jgi:predicted small secreted protein
VRPGRFVVPAVLALSGALAACNGAEPFSPDAGSLEGRGVSRSVDDAICQYRLSLVTVSLSAPTVVVGGSVDVSAVLMGWHDNVLDLTPDWFTRDHYGHPGAY